MQDKGTGHVIGWWVRMGVKGGNREVEQQFYTLEDAERCAKRWRSTNSTGEYWAILTPIKVAHLAGPLRLPTGAYEKLRQARKDAAEAREHNARTERALSDATSSPTATAQSTADREAATDTGALPSDVQSESEPRTTVPPAEPPALLPTPQEIAWCASKYRIRGKRNGWLYNRCRTKNNRSFPTGYPVPAPSATLSREEEQHRVTELIDALGMGGSSRDRARHATAADKRVFVGPSNEDIAALPHIDEAWCLAEHLCHLAGMRATTVRRPLGYGVLLDFATRDFAQRLGRQRDGLPIAVAHHRYGFDLLRIAVEHNSTPDELRQLAARAGLRAAA